LNGVPRASPKTNPSPGNNNAVPEDGIEAEFLDEAPGV